jgi:DNA-binding XRE family transcriptional regulator
VAVARDAVEGWLELHLEDGDAPPRPRARRGAAGQRAFIAVPIDASLAVRLEIRWARQDAGLSQGQLATLVGVTRQQISLLETRGSNLTIATLRRVADALGCDVHIGLARRETAA